MNLEPQIKLWLNSEDVDGVFGDGKYRLLKAIGKHGSLTMAAKSLNMSYRKAWNDLKKAEERFGKKLIDKSRGGPGGGRTNLTKEGGKLLEAYTKFENNMKKIVIKEYKKTMEKTINESF